MSADPHPPAAGGWLQRTLTAVQTRQALAIAWLLLCWLATQVPQIHSGFPVSDGLPRADLLWLHQLGVDVLAGSLVAALLAAITALVLVACLRMGAVRWGAAEAAIACAALTVAAGLAWSTDAAAPLVLDAPVEERVSRPGVPQAVAAWRADGGGPAPASGRWQAACAGVAADALKCVIVGDGVRYETQLAPGLPAEDHDETWTWLATAPSMRLPPAHAAGGNGPTTGSGQPPGRWLESSLDGVGPVAVGGAVHGDLHLRVAAALAPHGQQLALPATGRVVRLQAVPSRPVWPLVAAVVVAACAAVLRDLRRREA